MADERIVIVGGGMAGAKAAEGARAEGFEGELVLVGEEGGVPYERPPLSKDFLRGEASRDEHLRPPGVLLLEHGIELRSSDARRRIGRPSASSCSTTASALATTGCCSPPAREPRRLPTSRAPISRACATCAASRTPRRSATAIGSGMRLVVVGAGWIGGEVAASARQLGLRGHARRAALAAAASACSGRASAASTATCTPSTASTCAWARAWRRFEGDGAVERGAHCATATLSSADAGGGRRRRRAPDRARGGGRPRARQRDRGRRAPGVERAGRLRRGRRRPRRTRCFGRLRVEHWANALNQGLAAARAMPGAASPTTASRTSSPTSTTSAWSTRGYATSRDDELVFRGDPGDGEFIAFWLATAA